MNADIVKTKKILYIQVYSIQASSAIEHTLCAEVKLFREVLSMLVDMLNRKLPVLTFFFLVVLKTKMK